MGMKARLLKTGATLGALVLGLGVVASLSERGRRQSTVLPAAPADIGDFEDRLSMPDLTQTDHANCAPTAVSNSLMWLAGRGYPTLSASDPGLSATDAAGPGGQALELDGNPETRQIRLARILASERYMSTQPKRGTPLPDMLAGLEAFLRDRGIAPKQLSYRGWRIMPERFKSGPHPDRRWIEEGLSGARAVWIQVGFYDFDAATGDYHRLWGHTITLVAKGKDEEGNVGWVAHDPAPYCGETRHHELILASPLRGGRLNGDYVGLPQPASGFYRLTGWPVPDRADVAILDGATRLDL